MNHVKTVLIAIALLNMHYTYNGQISLPSSDISNFSNGSTLDDIESLLQPDAPKETNNTQTNDLQAWKDHLELLTTHDQYWDNASNNPTNEWKNTAFDLAEKIITQDKSLAESLKTDFITALNKKTTNFLDISNLITEFSDKINDWLQTAEITQELTTSAPPSPIVPETTPSYSPQTVPESSSIQTETVPTSSSDTTNESSLGDNQTDSESATKDQAQENWSQQLEKIKTEGENWVQIDDILTTAYQAAKELLKLGQVKENRLQADLRKALIERSVKEKIKPLYRLNIDDTMYYFNNSIGLVQEQSAASFDQPYGIPESNTTDFITLTQPQQKNLVPENDAQLEQLKKEYAEKDAKLKEEQKKAADDRRVMLAAAQKAQEEGTLAKEQVYKLAEAQKKLDEEYKKKREKDLEEINAAKKSLLHYTEQMAASQKAAAEKGLLSTFTDTLSNWWYGTTAQKPEGISTQQEKDLLAMMVKDVPAHLQEAAQQTFKKFQDTLLSFNKAPFWDERKSLPTLQWSAEMDKLIKDIVITYKLMKPTAIADFIKNILEKSGKISAPALKTIMSKIQTKTNQALAEKERKKAAEQLITQRRQEKKEQVLLAQQRAEEEQKRIKSEQERLVAEQHRLVQAANTYRQEKKEWYGLLDKLAQSKQATPEENHAHMQKALEKSQSLLRLASDLPEKDKARVSQKLKQKFSVALLNQQKNGAQGTNVYHHMDLFNKEINKMVD